MKVYSFFKLLNEKIKKYEQAISNPYERYKKPVTIIWIENSDNKNIFN